MLEKRDAFRYVLIGAIGIVLVSILLVLRGGPTGYLIFEQTEEANFTGAYVNVIYNGSAIILSEDNLTGTYTSQIFDAGNEAVWNNLSWVSGEPNVEFLFVVDGGGEVFKSSNVGVTWVMTKENYGRTTDGADMFSNANALYILAQANKEVYKSTDLGITWDIVNDTFTNDGLFVGAVDSNENLYVVTGPGNVYKSTDSGVTWSFLSDFNAGTNDPKGIAINSSDDIYVVDGLGDVYSSIDLGMTWTKVNDGYGGSAGTDGMVVDGGDNLYILINSEVYKSTDSGVIWTKINDDFSPYSNDGFEIGIDFNDNLYILDGIGRVFKSINSGGDWSEIGDCNNAAGSNPKGFTTFIESSTLDIQVKSCDDSECSGESWVDISDTSPQDLGVDNNVYFQYKIDFTSPDSSVSPSLISIDINYDLVNTAPIINFVNPQEGASYGYNTSIALDFSVSDADDNLESCWYNFNGGANISLVGCANTTFDIAEGSHDLNIYANDSLGLIDSDSSSFSVVTTAPAITLVYPENNFYLNYMNNIYFNYSVSSGLSLSVCQLWGDWNGWHLNQTDNNPVDGDNFFILNLTDDNYKWGIVCNDSDDRFNNVNFSFSIDTINPSLSLSEPSGEKDSKTGIALTFVTNDDNLDKCYYNITTSVGTDIVNDVEVINCFDTSFDVSSDGDYIIYLWVIDSAGNLNSTNSSFSVDSSEVPVTLPSGGSGGGDSPSGGGSFIIPNQTGKMEVSLMGDIIAYAGDNKNLSINVKNTGRVFLNKCKLIINGDLNNWIYSSVLKGIAPGENLDFVFNINVPEGIAPGDYVGELEVSCDEGFSSQNFSISIPGFSAVKIGEMIQEGKILTINYNFDNSNFIGEFVLIDIWVVDELGGEVQRIQDGFEINTDALIERVVEIDVGELSGTYEVYFALSSNLDESVKHSILLAGKGLTGFAVLDVTKNKTIVYAVFLVFLGVFVFFIWRRHSKKDKSNPHHKKFKHSKHHWLLRKKK